MSIEEEMRVKLMDGLSPVVLDIINESHLHHGHAGSPGTGHSHFRMKIISPEFEGKSRVERHRLVNEILREELSGAIHALALSTLAPDEAGADN